MISVIVPVYNMKKYLAVCVDSITNQTHKELEIILVDDGSTDNSLELCYQLAERDARINVIHKENGGQGSARNVALDVANGKYVAFVDSDDYIQPDMYETLLRCFEDHEVDMAVSKTGQFFNDDLSDLHHDSSGGTISTFDCLEAQKILFSANDIILHSPCNKLYKRELFDGLRFLENRLLEDTAMTYKVIDKCRKIAHVDKVGYWVRCLPNSVSRRKYSVRRCDTIKTYEEVVSFFEQNKKYESLVSVGQAYANGAVFYNAGEFYNSKIKDSETKKLIEEHAAYQRKNYNSISKKNKLLLYCVEKFFSLYGTIYRIKH